MLSLSTPNFLFFTGSFDPLDHPDLRFLKGQDRGQSSTDVLHTCLLDMFPAEGQTRTHSFLRIIVCLGRSVELILCLFKLSFSYDTLIP